LPGAAGPMLGPAAGALLGVDAIDQLAGPELKHIIGNLTGASQEYLDSIPDPTLKQRVKNLVAGFTGPVKELGGYLKRNLAPDASEAAEARAKAGFEEKVASEKEAEYTARASGATDVRSAPWTIGKHRLPFGTVMGTVKESKLNKLIKEEILKELYPQWRRQEDRVKLQHQFGPKDVEEMAKQLSLEAGERDQTTYSWQNFIDHAKEKLTKGDLTSGDSF
jgi:hypothetical protein